MSTQKKELRVAAGLIAISILALTAWLVMAKPESEQIEFVDVERQTLEFIDYYHSIQLTPEQTAIKRAALESLPAPCCSDRTADTCCCPCNSAKAWWGLSYHLIADRGADVEEVRATVSRWFQFINPDGFNGKSCYTGGCMRPFREGGCGGMSEQRLTF